MSVAQNIKFGAQNPEYFDELMSIFELGELRDRMPDTLSGGQQQRVALARSLMTQPELLLLDEPLSSLDYRMRLQLQEYLLKIHRKKKFTMIIVTHDIGEIFKLADQVIMLDHGKIKQSGSPYEIYTRNQSSGKFRFTGEVMAIHQQEVLFILDILIGNELVQVVADESDVQNIHPGQRVVVSSKAFNPIVVKIQDFTE